MLISTIEKQADPHAVSPSLLTRTFQQNELDYYYSHYPTALNIGHVDAHAMYDASVLLLDDYVLRARN